MSNKKKSTRMSARRKRIIGLEMFLGFLCGIVVKIILLSTDGFLF